MKKLLTSVTLLWVFLIVLPVNASVFLHGTGPNENPPALFFDNTSPTATTAKYRDSAGVKFIDGNRWKEIGTWRVTKSGSLTQLNDLHIWLGLKNSDDIGTYFDLRAEVYKNDQLLITSGEVYCIKNITRNPDKAKEVTVFFDPFPFVKFDHGDVLSLKVLTRIGSNGAGASCGGHSNAVGLRLYFDAVSRPAKFNTTLTHSLLMNGPPHFVYGKVLNSEGAMPGKDHTETYAYIPSRPDEILDKSSAGSGYDIFSNGGWLWFEAGNYPTSWSINENLRVMVLDNQRGETGAFDIVFNNSGSQLLPDLTLGAGDRIGPVAYNAKVDGTNPASVPEGKPSIILTALISDSLSGGHNIQRAEYYINNDPGLGLGNVMSAKDEAFDNPREGITATININTLSWTPGSTHIIYVRGQDVAGNWGTAHGVIITVTGP